MPTLHCSSQATIRRAALLWILTLFLALAASAPAQQAKFPPEKRAEIEKAVSSFMSVSHAPGVSVAVVQDGEFVWSQGFGMADLENSVPATSSTLYRLGSVSKPITAVAAMLFWERGQLDLDAPVQKYCPGFPQKEWAITTRQLLGHLGGIRHYNPDGKGDVPEDSARHFASMEESLKLFAADPLVAKPSAKFSYSTYGYTLVGCVLEGAGLQKFTDLVREKVFAPASMDHTQEDNFFVVIPHRTRWYHKDKSGTVQNAGVLDSSYKIPGGGMISSADDIARFEVAILSDQLLKRATRDVMWSPQVAADGKPTGYGLGWGVRKEDNVTFIGHSGGQQGTSTGIILAPDRRAGVVVLANMDGVNAYALATQIMRIELNLPPKAPSKE